MVGKTSPSTAQAERRAGRARGAEKATDDEKTRRGERGLVKGGEKMKGSRGENSTGVRIFKRADFTPAGRISLVA